MPLSKSKVNLLLNLLSDSSVKLVAGSKVRVFHQPVAYLVRVLGVMVGDVFLVDVAHYYDFVCPGKQAFRNTLRAVVAALVPDFLQSEQHFAWNLSM